MTSRNQTDAALRTARGSTPGANPTHGVDVAIDSAMHDEPSAFGPVFDPRRSVVLVASAGTGKTWRLVRRYLRIIAGQKPGSTEPWAAPEQVVAVTFTRAAAAEMRARLFAALTIDPAEVQRSPSGDTDELEVHADPILAEVVRTRTHDERLALAERLAVAPIGTLHSLCARLLAEFPELSGVPPDARPLEPAEQALELDAFVAAWLDRAIAEPSAPAHARVLELLHAHPLGFIRSELRAMVEDREDPTAGWSELLGPVGAPGTEGPVGAPGTEGPVGAPGTEGSVGAPDTEGSAGAERGLQLVRESPVEQPTERSLADTLLGVRGLFVRTQWRELLQELQPALSLVWQACVLELQRSGAQTSPRVHELGERLTRLFQRHLPEPDPATIAADFAAIRQIRPHRELGPIRELQHQLLQMIRVASTRRERPVLPDPQTALDPAHAEHLARWIELAHLLRTDWAANLRGRALLRYDDLERLALDLLAHPAAQAHLRGRYRHLLVDEYQDINPIQAEILDRLADVCGDRVRLFYVGDPKQSIYRFRGADPEVFARATALHRESVVALEHNHRSSPTLARFFEALFPPLFAGQVPVLGPPRPPELARLIEVSDHAPVPWQASVIPTREHDDLPGLAVDLLLRDARRPAEPEHPELLPEASRVAVHLAGLLASNPTLRARDVAILLPRWSLAEDHRAALEVQGIAADLAGGRGLLLLAEVRDLVNLVRCWADEQDDLGALGVLRGPCFAISDLGLYVLARWPGVDRRTREADPDLPEFAHLDEVWESWDDEASWQSRPSAAERANARPMREVLRHGRLDPARAVEALIQAGVLAEDRREVTLEQLTGDARALEHGRDRLRALERHAGARSTADLLADVIAEFRLEAHWLISARGRRAVANAWRFVEHVRTLESEGPDLQRLCTWLDAGAEPAPEGLISPEADAITITTWHGAKGKEWRVVVVAGLGEYREASGRTSWSREGVPTLDSARGQRLPVPRIRKPHEGFWADPDPLHEVCSNMLTPLEAAEAKRLLYVAMTRARDRLVLSGEADSRAFISFDDRPFLGLDYRAPMDHLLGEPKPPYLSKRPIELLVAALDLSAADQGRGQARSVLRPRAGAWSLAHLRVIDDRTLLAGLERDAAVDGQPGEPEHAPTNEQVESHDSQSHDSDSCEPHSYISDSLDSDSHYAIASDAESSVDYAESRDSLPPLLGAGPIQLDFESFFSPPPAHAHEPTLETPSTKPEDHDDPILRWRAGPKQAIWRPSGGRSPWPVSAMSWDMPLPARRAAVLDDEDPQQLGELFHAAMQAWDFVGDPPDESTLARLVGRRFGAREITDQRRLTQWLVRCIEMFVDSELLPELRDARSRDQLFHEVELDTLVPANERDHRISGRIDLLWRDAGGLWNVLDYKASHKVRSLAQMQELQWEYGPQLLLYRKALQRWRPPGEMLFLGRFGLWLATAGKAMWVRDFGE